MKKDKTKQILSLSFNLLLILLELFALSEVFFRYLPGTTPFKWYDSLTYYTNLSNISLLIGAILTLVNLKREKEGKKLCPLFVHLKFLGVVVTSITFVTVYIFMIFTRDPKWGFSLTGSSWLFMHTINPLLGSISLYFFDPKTRMNRSSLFIPLIYTALYVGMILLVAACGGRIPYLADFENQPENPFPVILLSGLVEMSASFLLSLLGRWLINQSVTKKGGNKGE